MKRQNAQLSVILREGPVMCFRPSAIALPKKCPKCGNVNDPEAEVCAKCGEKLPDEQPDMPGMPGAPGAGAPKAPGVPGAPGAPKAPGA